MSYLSRVYRHRNPKREQQKPGNSFFIHAAPGSVQTKKDDSFFQAKLQVNEPGDKFEQEADAVANNVVNSPQQNAGNIQRKKISGIQRLSTSKEAELTGTDEERMRMDKDIQRKEMPKEEEDEMKMGAAMQRKAEPGAGASASPQLSSRVEQSAGKGRTIPGKTLSHMQSSFGEDFSNVSIHTDQESIAMNKELGAQAFTHGRDIYFNSGKYNPENTEGKKLLAHELTHVVQQTSSKVEH
ncbi:MAG TPA: DUF4157 domain-containing protein [Chitinophagaceae bacterium]|nr:DUF4157 domain-containing protein [Chitinophagaceae bacterium]